MFGLGAALAPLVVPSWAWGGVWVWQAFPVLFLIPIHFLMTWSSIGEDDGGVGALALLWRVEEAEKLQSSLSFFKPLRFISNGFFLFFLIFLLRLDILERQPRRSRAYFGLHPRK